MKLPAPSYVADDARLAQDAPVYWELIVRAGRKEPRANILFRKLVRDRCRVDKGFRELVWELCRRDVLFFANTFCIVQEPRGRGGVKILPFITYDYQDRYILDVMACQGVRPTTTLKSRDMGVTWMWYGIIRVWWFLFSNASFICGSRKDELVDATENPDTMFAKFDAVLAALPWWFVPDYDPKDTRCKQVLHRFNPETGAVLTGASTAEDFARGGRRTGADIDEFAAWDVAKSHAAMASVRPATDCLNTFSTPQGDIGAFRDNWFNPNSPDLKIELKWEDHPRYRRGLYTSREGVLELLDDDFWDRGGVVVSRWIDNQLHEYTRETYPFILDDEVRSPWFDAKEAELGSPVRVAQELRRSFTGSDSPFFDHAVLLRVETKFAKAPVLVSNPELEPDSCRLVRFRPTPTGMFSLWIEPDEKGRAPADRLYAMGVDVSAGTRGAQASNSVISVFDRLSGDQVSEFASNAIKPGRLAEYANALGHWFNWAMIAWEAGTHGDTFMDRLFVELRYPNVYYMRQNESERGVKLKRSPGWWVRPKSKMAAFHEFAAAQSQERIKLRSVKALAEQRQFVWSGPESVEHRAALSAEQPSERKGSHGDRVSAAILAFKIMDEWPLVPTEKPKVVRPWTLQWLMDQRAGEEADGRTLMPLGRPYGAPHAP